MKDETRLKVLRENAATVAAVRGLSDFNLLLLVDVLQDSRHVSASALRAHISDGKQAILNPPSPPAPLTVEQQALFDEVAAGLGIK